jgi:hypothetical protein
MPTRLTAPLHASKKYEVRFINDMASTGTVLVTGGWVPKHQQAVPASQSAAVAPATADGFDGKVPEFSRVRRLSITVSLDDGEFGVLEVLEDDRPHTRKPVIETTTFEMPVDP